MNILILTNMDASKSFPYTGIYVKNQVERIREFLPPSDTLDFFKMKYTKTNSVGTFIKYSISFLRFFPFIFKKYNIIHVHYFIPIYLFAYIYKIFHSETKIIVTFHGADATGDFRGIRIPLFRYLNTKINYIISVDEEIIPDIENKLQKKVDILLCAGIDKRGFYPLKEVKKDYDFIFIGALGYHKGIDLVIDAIKKFDNKKVRFCIIGVGPYFEEVKKLCNEYNISLYSYKDQNELRKFYNKSKFFLFPMRQLGVGLAIREALYCGTPVIAPPHPGIIKILKEGENGFIINNFTVEEVLSKIELALNISENQYQLLSSNAAKLSEIHSLDYVCKKQIEIYNGLDK